MRDRIEDMYDWDHERYMTADEVRAAQRKARDRWESRLLFAGLSLIVYLFWGDLAWLAFAWFTIPFWL